MRAFVCVLLAAWSVVIPLRNICSAIGDLGVDVERVPDGAEKIDRCKYCGRFINVGRVHADAGAIVTNQLEAALTERDTGFVEGKTKTDYINVLIYRYEERQGGNYAVDKPASVGFHMHFVNRGTVKRVFVCEEDQQALMDNLFSIGKFMSRGGKWVTVERLSSDCIKKGLNEFLEALE
jgi:hypothetical protein